MSQYFPYLKCLGGNVKVDLDLSNYATKSDLKNEIAVNTYDLAKKVDLAIFKSKVHELDIDKLEKVPNDLISLKSKVDDLDIDTFETFPVDLSILSDVVTNDVVTKKEYDESVKTFNGFDTSGLLKKQIIIIRLKILNIKYLT